MCGWREHYGNSHRENKRGGKDEQVSGILNTALSALRLYGVRIAGDSGGCGKAGGKNPGADAARLTSGCLCSLCEAAETVCESRG